MIRIKIKREEHKNSTTTTQWGYFLQIYLIAITRDRIWMRIRALKSNEFH